MSFLHVVEPQLDAIRRMSDVYTPETKDAIEQSAARLRKLATWLPLDLPAPQVEIWPPSKLYLVWQTDKMAVEACPVDDKTVEITRLNMKTLKIRRFKRKYPEMHSILGLLKH